MSTVNLQQYAKVFTARLRSRMHNQAFAQSVQETRRKALRNPIAKAAARKVDEVDALCRLHRRTYDPGLKSKALHLYQQLPLPLSTEEDPNFVLATRALRVASHVDAADHPLTFSLLNHCTKHSYLLDAFSLVKLLQALRGLHHPQTVEALKILLPRLEQVTSDLTASEAAGLLQILFYFEMDKVMDLTTLQYGYGRVIEETVASLEVVDMTKCLRAVPLLPPEPAMKVVLKAAPALLQCIRTERELQALLLATTTTTTTTTSSPSSAPTNQENKAAAAAPQTSDENPSSSSGESGENNNNCETQTQSPAALRAEQIELLEQHIALHRAVVEAFLHVPEACGKSDTARRVVNELMRSTLSLTISSSSPSRATTRLPVMGRGDIRQSCRLLHLCSYRHLPALQRLTSSYLIASSSRLLQPIQQQTPHARALEELRELTQVVESLGFFMVPLVSLKDGDGAEPNGTLQALCLILGDEEAGRLVRRCLLGDHHSRLGALACVSRLWHSVAELGKGNAGESAMLLYEERTYPDATVTTNGATKSMSTTPSPSPQAAAAAAARVLASALAPALEWAWISPEQLMPQGSADTTTTTHGSALLQRYIRSATCHQDAQRTARLLRRLTEVCLVLQTAPASSWSARSMRAARSVMEGLLTGLVHHYEHRVGRVRSSGSGSHPPPHPSSSSSPSSSAYLSEREQTLALVDAAVRDDLAVVLRHLPPSGGGGAETVATAAGTREEEEGEARKGEEDLGHSHGETGTLRRGDWRWSREKSDTLKSLMGSLSPH